MSFCLMYSHFVLIGFNFEILPVQEPGKELLISLVFFMYTVAINLRINEKSVSEYVVEVAYTALYFDSDLCVQGVQEAGKDYICFAP